MKLVEIYLPYLILIMAACLTVGLYGGYLFNCRLKKGNQFNVLLRNELKKREKLQAELNLEILHNKQLEEALETMIQNEADRENKTLTKIPEKKILRRRVLGSQAS